MQIFDKPGNAFLEEQEFSNIAKMYLTDSNAVLKNALATDEDVYISSF